VTSPVLPVLLDDGVALGSSSRPLVDEFQGGSLYQLGTEATFFASTSADANGLFIHFGLTTATSGGNSDTILNIEINGVVRWAVSVGYQPTNTQHILPGFIPAGSAVTAQIYSASNKSFNIYFSLLGGPKKFGTPLTLTTLNHVPGTSAKGVVLATPGSTNVKGAWTELVASTPVALSALAIQVGGNSDLSINSGSLLVDIGIGGVGSETVLLGDLMLTMVSTEQVIARSPMAYSLDIPAGSRLSARCQYSTSGLVPDVNLVGAGKP
jgi:hypothetical protein